MTSSLKDAWRAVAICAQQIIPVRVRANPDAADCHAFCDDIELLERRIVEGLLRAYADAAVKDLGVGRDDADSFMAVITDAFADFRGAVLCVAEEIEEQRRDEYADMQRDFRREDAA